MEMKYLIFRLANRYFSVQLNEVLEVVPYFNFEPVPCTPTWYKGLFNLRGKIISVLDLKNKLGKGDTEITLKETTLIVLKVEGYIFGIMVDETCKVHSFKESDFVDDLKKANKNQKEIVKKIIKDDELGVLLNLNLYNLLEIEKLEYLQTS